MRQNVLIIDFLNKLKSFMMLSELLNLAQKRLFIESLLLLKLKHYLLMK